MSRLIHTVHTRFYNAPQEKQIDMLSRFQGLGEACGGKESGILYWDVRGEGVDNRKVDMVQFAVFRDRQAFEAFRRHPVHTRLKEELRECADWNSGNTELEGSELKGLIEALSA